MQPHFLALQGVAKLLETVHLVSRRMNPKLKVTGVVLTMFDAQTKLSMEVVNELNGFIMDAAGKPLPWASREGLRHAGAAEHQAGGVAELRQDDPGLRLGEQRGGRLPRRRASCSASATPPPRPRRAADGVAAAKPVARRGRGPNPPPCRPRRPARAVAATNVDPRAATPPRRRRRRRARRAPAPTARPAAVAARPAAAPPQRTGPIRPVPPVAARPPAAPPRARRRGPSAGPECCRRRDGHDQPGHRPRAARRRPNQPRRPRRPGPRARPPAPIRTPKKPSRNGHEGR